MFKKTVFVVMLMASVFFISCSKHQRLIKSTDNELKYQKAIEYYEKGDYYRAIQLMEQIIPVYRGTAKAEKLYFNYAYAYYGEHDYVMASYYFQRFTTTFPFSSQAEEAAYMSAYCKYLESPRYSLDQATTNEAIDEFQTFINKYPYGEKAKEATEKIDELRQRLMDKAYSIANLYYHMEDYRAAIVSYENVLKEFPDTKYQEDILYRIMKSYFKYASNSVNTKKRERYESALKAYYDFSSLYPESDYMTEVIKMRDKVVEILKTVPESEI